jgi:hypothetical protein
MRSSEFLRFMRPTESGTRCSLALNRSLRFMARTLVSLSSCVPAPTWDPAPAGPHCLGGGALTDVRRPCAGLRLRALSGVVCVPSLPMTFAAMSCIADHEFPSSPVNLAEFSGLFGICMPVARRNGDEGSGGPLRRGLPGLGAGMGDAFLDVRREPVRLAASSLAPVAYMSSSTEISRRVRGRNVELLLDVDSEALAGFMAVACTLRAVQVKLDLHTPNGWGGQVNAWHVIT